MARTTPPFLPALLVALSTVFAASAADAHKPSYGGVDVFGSPEDAYEVEDFDVSIVVYHEVTCRSEQLWMRYEAPEEDAGLYVQLGVPVIDRLSDYRPSVAILAPGLPELDEDLPFEVPDGFGGLVIHTEGVDQPEDFYEPFSQTDSWILHEETIPVPAGEGYVVAWHPGRETGKLWVATGTVEDFGPEDFDNFGDWMVLTKTFHEVDPYSPAEEPVEEVCEDPGLELPEQTERDEEETAGCSQADSPASGGALVLLLGVLSLALRDRRRFAAAPR